MEVDGPYVIIREPDYEIWILRGTRGLNPDNDNVDVEVRLSSEERYLATFFTLQNIRHLMRKWRGTDECKGGLYFWCPDMIIVEKLTEETVRETISHLVSTGEIECALVRAQDE
jgi:hypothetical protein